MTYADNYVRLTGKEQERGSQCRQHCCLCVIAPVLAAASETAHIRSFSTFIHFHPCAWCIYIYSYLKYVLLYWLLIGKAKKFWYARFEIRNRLTLADSLFLYWGNRLYLTIRYHSIDVVISKGHYSTGHSSQTWATAVQCISPPAKVMLMIDTLDCAFMQGLEGLIEPVCVRSEHL